MRSQAGGGAGGVSCWRADPIAPSDASESLLRSILTVAGIPLTSDNILLYSRPSAWADIATTKDVYSDNGVDIVIDSLRLELQYDFVRKSTSQVELEVLTPQQGLMPYFVASQTDLNGRQDALGGVQRTYSKNTSVTVTAPKSYGDWQFEKWTDAYGNSLPGTPGTNVVLTMALTDNKSVRAQYVYGDTNDTDADTMADAWEVANFGSVTNADLTTDHDGDGVPDWQEYVNGRNPLLADSDGDRLTDWQEFVAGTSGRDASDRFTVKSRLEGGSPVLSWKSVPDRVYSVYATPELNQAWIKVGAVIGAGGEQWYTNGLPGAAQGFFKVEAAVPISP